MGVIGEKQVLMNEHFKNRYKNSFLQIHYGLNIAISCSLKDAY